jgi:HEPN domain-containing protein
MANRDPEILAKVSQWVAFADDDLKLASNVMDLRAEDTPYRLIAYHAQQCAEKYIKAFLVYCGADFPYTHNIRRLLRLCSQHADWPGTVRDA